MTGRSSSISFATPIGNAAHPAPFVVMVQLNSDLKVAKEAEEKNEENIRNNVDGSEAFARVSNPPPSSSLDKPRLAKRTQGGKW